MNEVDVATAKTEALLGIYRQPDIVFVEGDGPWLVSDRGERYLARVIANTAITSEAAVISQGCCGMAIRMPPQPHPGSPPRAVLGPPGRGAA